MKKISVLVLVMVFVFAVSTFASASFMENVKENGNFAVKMGMDFNGSMSDGTNSYDVDSALTLSGEYLMPYKNNVEMGVGLNYQMERELTDVSGKFNFTTLYGLAKMTTEMGNYSPYFMGQIGYGLFNFDGEDTKNGLYYGIGAGMNVGEGLDAEILYSVNKGEVDSTEIDYSSIRAGVSFAF